MAKKISELPPSDTLTGDELLETVQDGENKQTTINAVKEFCTPEEVEFQGLPEGGTVGQALVKDVGRGLRRGVADHCRGVVVEVRRSFICRTPTAPDTQGVKDQIAYGRHLPLHLHRQLRSAGHVGAG
jgi:hypothetical protein